MADRAMSTSLAFIASSKALLDPNRSHIAECPKRLDDLTMHLGPLTAVVQRRRGGSGSPKISIRTVTADSPSGRPMACRVPSKPARICQSFFPLARAGSRTICLMTSFEANRSWPVPRPPSHGHPYSHPRMHSRALAGQISIPDRSGPGQSRPRHAPPRARFLGQGRSHGLDRCFYRRLVGPIHCPRTEPAKDARSLLADDLLLVELQGRADLLEDLARLRPGRFES